MNESKRILGTAAIALLLLAKPLAAQDADGQPFTIKISPLTAEINNPKFVMLKILMTNTSGSDVNAGAAYDGSIDAAYAYDAKDEYGNPVPERTPSSDYRPNFVMRTLKPGESVTEGSNLAAWYDFSQPGKYTIQVSRFIHGNIGDPVIKSNIVTVTVLPPQEGAQGSAAQPFTIKITPLSATIQDPNSVVVGIVMTNTSNDDVDAGAAYYGSIDGAYNYDVTDQYGNAAAPKTLSHRHRVTFMMRTLKPGQSVTENSNVARCFDFSQPGQYTIQVSRSISGNDGDPVVKSNIVTVTVLPPQEP